MKIRKKLIATFLTIGLSTSLWGMDEPNNNKLLPEEVLVLIFKWLEPENLCKAFRICSNWQNVSNGPEIWSIISQKIFPLKFPRITDSKQSCKDIFINTYERHLLSKQILKMKDRPREELERLLLSQDRTVERALIRSLEITFQEEGRYLIIKEAKQAVSFFLAYYLIHNSALIAAGRCPCSISTEDGVDSYINFIGAFEEAMDEIEIEDEHDIVHDIVAEFWSAQKVNRRLLKHSVEEAMPTCARALDEDNKTFELPDIFALAFIAQPDFIAAHFKPIYDMAFDICKNKNFEHSLNNIKIIFADCIWFRPGQADYIYIKSFKALVEGILPEES